MKPSNAIIQNFIGRKADMLILFNTHRSIPLLYIAHATKATFKIGRYDKSCYGILDFMIKMESPFDLKKMMGHVGHYLQLIKNEKK